jgi:hypothetical protein
MSISTVAYDPSGPAGHLPTHKRGEGKNLNAAASG